ncbi:MAG: beta-galactosidase, partial [bacterium]
MKQSAVVALVSAVLSSIVCAETLGKTEHPIVLGNKQPYHTSPPATYIIATPLNEAMEASLLESFKNDVPEVIHVGPPTVGLYSAVGPVHEYFDGHHVLYDLADQDEVLEKEAEIRGIIERLHKAGVKAVICYLCNQTMAGDTETRLGFWEFYDRWDEYPNLDLGPKPETDPIQWMQRWPDGELHFTYPKDMDVFKPGFRYQPCPNNPEWRKFMRTCTRRIAQLGYDGIFVDNCILHCYCKHCQKRFNKYLESRYPREQWRELFGTAFGGSYGRAQLFDPERGNAQTPYDYEAMAGPLKIHPDIAPGDALLWAETQRFWADSIVEQIGELKEESTAARGKPFAIVANWGAMYRTNGVNSRRQDGKDVAQFNRICDGIMFEDELDMGRLATGRFYDSNSDSNRCVRGLYNDNILQYKYTLALGASPVELPYVRPIESLYELGLAECWAGGGGAFCWSGPQFSEIRGRYAEFKRNHPELYEGLSSFSRVGLCFFYDQLFFENTAHLREVYALSHRLVDQGVLFDFVPESACNLETLRKWKTVIVPCVTHLSDEQREILTEYARQGGTLMLIGDDIHYCAERTETGIHRTPPLFSEYGFDGPGMAAVEKMLDMEIKDKNAFFQIYLPDGRKGYTHNGQFTLDKDGQVVTSDGYPLEPPMMVSTNVRWIRVAKDGTVSSVESMYDSPPNMQNPLGQLQPVTFSNPSGLEATENGILLETADSGPPILHNPWKDPVKEVFQRRIPEPDPFQIAAENMSENARYTHRYGTGTVVHAWKLSYIFQDSGPSFDALKRLYSVTGNLIARDRKTNGQELMARTYKEF